MHIKKTTESSQINILMLHLKLLEKQEQHNLKPAEGECNIKKGQNNKMETKKPYKESVEQKVGCLKR
jgi:hypothetical protein